MDRLSSPSAVAFRTEPLQLTALPEAMIAKIIATIDKADNQTLASLARTCKDLWRLASVDTLRSFFHAAREACEAGDNNTKVAVFCVLTDWITTVADQLPEATRWQLLGHLSHMARINLYTEPEIERMLKATDELFNLARREVLNDEERMRTRLESEPDKKTAGPTKESQELERSLSMLIKAHDSFRLMKFLINTRL